MLARGGSRVALGILLDHLNVAHQRGAGEDAFEEIVTQQRVFGNAPGQRRLEGIDVVDALAGKRPFAEEILIDVGDREDIWIGAAAGREDALEDRAVIIDRQGWCHARLQYAVSTDDTSQARIEPRPVQRVSQLADQPPRRVARKFRVGVERDDEADIRGKPAADDHETRVAGAPEQAVQFMELAALALPAHPRSLLWIPAS